jgi:hypothetical protein
MFIDSERSQAGRSFSQHKVSNEPAKTRSLRQGLMNIDNQQHEMPKNGLNNAAVDKLSARKRQFHNDHKQAQYM